MNGHGRWGAHFRQIQQSRAAERQLEEMLRGMNGPRLAGPDLSERILARVCQDRVLLDGAERRWALVGRAGVVAATIAAAVGLGVLWVSGRAQRQPEPIGGVLMSVRSDTARTVRALPGLAIDLAQSLGGPGLSVGREYGSDWPWGAAASAEGADWTRLSASAALSTSLFQPQSTAPLDLAQADATRADTGPWPSGAWTGWDLGAALRGSAPLEVGHFMRLWPLDGSGRNESRLPR